LSVSGTPCVKQQSVQNMPLRQQERVVVIACLANVIDHHEMEAQSGEWIPHVFLLAQPAIPSRYS
jgi:hypothetical protein